MIHAKEVNTVATQNKLKDSQIEKDYVLSWLLLGISKNPVLSTNLVFKGGTVLKKVYFPDYRFSEDLDFTLLDNNITNQQLLAEFEKVYAFVKEEANITVQFKESNTHISGSIGFYLNYIGPLLGNLGSRDVKIDITRGEIMEFPVEQRKVFILYSDLPQDSFSLQCYALPEVLIEKMAALMGRTEPRDLYDFWYLNESEGIDAKYHKPEFERKAKNKGHDPADFEKKVLAKEKNLEQGWQKKLEDQIHDLPKYSDVFRESKRHFKI
ncbi:MAG: nucleotidyl transferase AbiEii/AbiGii toxin family protein [Chitinophagaceae bacterium]|nr:nucleotidyl transferase AbiEii/AbiGii toxin family protein [Chitinophagaceae bacterium]